MGLYVPRETSGGPSGEEGVVDGTADEPKEEQGKDGGGDV